MKSLYFMASRLKPRRTEGGIRLNQKVHFEGSPLSNIPIDWTVYRLIENVFNKKGATNL